MRTQLLIYLVLVVSNSHAQIPDSFTQFARNKVFGEHIPAIAAGHDSTLFLAIPDGGLYALRCEGNEFVIIEEHYSSAFEGWESAMDLTIGPDGTIFLANGEDGLRAFTFDGDTFLNTAHIDEGGAASGVTIAPDGTVFLANGLDGIRAYDFDGKSFEPLAHYNWGNGWAGSIALGQDGTVYHTRFETGLYAYHFHDSVFTLAGNIDDVDEGIEYGVGAYDVEVGPDGIIYLANGRGGLRAYRHEEDLEFHRIALFQGEDVLDDANASSVTLAEDGTIFLAYGSGGLYALSLEDSVFIQNARTDIGDRVSRVTKNPDGTVFGTGLQDGLRAYEYSSSHFTQTGYFEINKGFANDVAVSIDGTIFLSTMDHHWEGDGGVRGSCDAGVDGLSSYKLNGGSLALIDHINYDKSFAGSVEVGKNGTVYLASTPCANWGNFWAYDYAGDSLSTSRYWEFPDTYQNGALYIGGSLQDIEIGTSGIVYLALGEHGLHAFNIHDDSITLAASINNGGEASGVAVAEDGTIFLANGSDGLRAYTFNGQIFDSIAHVNNGGIANGIEIDENGILFLANGSDGLRVYEFDGNDFRSITNANDGKVPGDTLWWWSDVLMNANDVDLGPDGTIFLANGIDGLRAYRYDGDSLINTAHIDSNSSWSCAISVKVGPDGTIFLANGYEGLLVYSYSAYENIDIFPPVVIAPDALIQPEYIAATSNEEGVIYLVPEGTEEDLITIQGLSIDSLSAIANISVEILLSGLNNGIYWLYAKDTAGNISEPEAFAILGVGMENAYSDHIKIYPNPTSTLLHINTGIFSQHSIEITSLNGRLLYQFNCEEPIHRLDLSSYQKGVYFITIRSKSFVTMRKIIKL